MDELRLPRQVFHMRCRKPEFLVCEDSDRDWNMALSAWPWTARQGLSSISVFGPRGKLVERREVNRGAALNYYLLRVPKDGLSGVYRIEIDDGEGAGCYGHSQWQVESGPQKVMARLPSDGAIASTGSHEFGWRFYFHVPKGTKEFTVKLSVVIRGTYCGRVFDPSGSLRGHASWTGHPIPTHQRVLRIADDRGLAPGVWSLAFKAYRALRIELEGIPPYVAARPEGAFEVGER